MNSEEVQCRTLGLWAASTELSLLCLSCRSSLPFRSCDHCCTRDRCAVFTFIASIYLNLRGVFHFHDLGHLFFIFGYQCCVIRIGLCWLETLFLPPTFVWHSRYLQVFFGVFLHYFWYHQIELSYCLVFCKYYQVSQPQFLSLLVPSTEQAQSRA